MKFLNWLTKITVGVSLLFSAMAAQALMLSPTGPYLTAETEGALLYQYNRNTTELGPYVSNYSGSITRDSGELLDDHYAGISFDGGSYIECPYCYLEVNYETESVYFDISQAWDGQASITYEDIGSSYDNSLSFVALFGMTDSPVPVPEPGLALLLLTGAAGLFGARRRQRLKA